VARDRTPVLLAGFLAAVFLAKLVVALQLKDHILLQPDAGLDTTTYMSLALRVVSGDVSLGPGLYFVSPLYIYFMAAVLGATSSATAIRIAQIVLGTISVGLVWFAAREWFGRRAAWVAAALAALTGLFTFYEVLLLQSALDPILTACALAALAAALNRDRRGWYVLAGLAFGIQTLNRPNVLIAAAGIAVLMLLARRWRAAAALAVGIAAGLMPVMIRNVAVSGDWSPVSSHGGLNFYIGNAAEANGTYRGVAGITPTIAAQQEDARRVAEQAVGRALDDADVSAYFYGLGTAWIGAHPVGAAKLFVRKLGYVFSAAHLWLNHSYPFYKYDARTFLRVLFVGPWLLIPLGLAGLGVAAWQRRSAGFLLWAAFVPLYAVAVAIFFVSERYRLPLLVPFCIGSGVLVDMTITAAAEHRLRSIAVAAAAAVAIAVAVNWPLGLDNGLAEERTRMAERLMMLDRYAEAEDWAARAEPIYPRPGVMHFRLGRRLLLKGKAEAALDHLQKAAALDPGQPEVDYAIGQALVDAGRAGEAIPHLRGALAAGVKVDLAGYDLARALAATGDRSGAARVLQGVRPARANDADSWYSLGQLAVQIQAPRIADAFFRQAIAARPDFAAAHQQIGVNLAMMGRFDEAVAELEQAVRLNPADAPAHLNLAVSYAELGRIADARAQAAEALRIDPSYERAQRLLGALKSP
jgi:tetratricopeptide (TPR) repeat protein